MEKKDEALIDQLLAAPGNDELRRLMKNHREFESLLEDFNKRLYLSDQEQLERKRLQKLKLAGRDRIDQILTECRQKGNSI